MTDPRPSRPILVGNTPEEVSVGYCRCMISDKRPPADATVWCRHGTTAERCEQACEACAHACQDHDAVTDECAILGCGCQNWLDAAVVSGN